jgi:prevent-host-death family protein
MKLECHMPKKISAAKFKAQCLSLIDRVGPDGIVITKNGKPVAKLLPISNGFSGFIGSMKGRLKIRGDISSTGLNWNAQS